MKGLLSDIVVVVVLALLSAAAGFFIGRSSVEVGEETRVEYRQLPAISVSIRPEPLSVSIPAAPQFLFFTDTITGVPVVDTAAILADWVLRREYGGRMIEDSTGTVDYSAVVQYNRIQDISVDYMPLQRTTTITRTVERRFTPFLFIGGNSAGFGAVEAGGFIGRVGVAAEVGTNFEGVGYIGGRVGVRF